MSSLDTATPSLNPDRSLRGFIVLISLLQGLALYFAQAGVEASWLPLGGGAKVLLYALTLSVPTVMTLTVQKLRDARFWQHIVGVALIFALLAAWVAWNAGGTARWPIDVTLAPFACTMALALFELLPYLQCRLTHGRWCAPYPELFGHGWQNGLTMLLLLPLAVLGWALLLACSELSKRIGVSFLSELFSAPTFVYLATGTLVGLGILVARTQRRMLQFLQRVVLAVGKGLLPLLALAELLLLLSLPIEGLDALWQTRHGALLLMLLVLLMVLLTNAVFQDGAAPGASTRYQKAAQRCAEAALAVLPIVALLALYALWLRVDQYGWTPTRLYVALLALLLTAYSLGYAYSALRRSPTWLAPLKTINVSLSWLTMGLILLLNSPVLDPFRLSAASQLSRLHDGIIQPAEVDLKFLRFDDGRPGRDALQELRFDADMGRDSRALAAVSAVLQQTRRDAAGAVPAEPAMTIADARKRIMAAPAADPLGDDWLQAVIDHHLESMSCLTSDNDCLVLSPDLDGDGVSERFLCEFVGADTAQCRLSTRRNGVWINVGTANYLGGDSEIKALREGRVSVQRPRWSNLVIDGETLAVSPE